MHAKKEHGILGVVLNGEIIETVETFGSYELTARLAFGGMAEIFRARRRASGGFTKNLVVKRVLPHMAEDRDFVSMFIDEAVLAAKLSHPNIVSTIDFGDVDGTYFIAMEYIEGVDLKSLLGYAVKAGEPIGANRAVQIALAMCRGLSHAHERTEDGMRLGIVHRDVSPHNVLISFDGAVKVTDFGIAKALARSTHTATGVIKGKLSYMAPEQARGEDVDARIDIYATGLVLWEMLAGTRAFVGDNDMQILRRVQAGDVQPLRERVADLPDDLVAVTERMLARDAADRHARMRDAERDLARVLHGLGGEGAAPLDEYLARVVPKETIESRRADAPIGSGTASMKSDASTGVVTEPELLASPEKPRDSTLTRVAAAEVVTVPVPRRKSPARFVLVGLAFLVLALVVGWAFFRSQRLEEREPVLAKPVAAEAPAASSPAVPPAESPQVAAEPVLEQTKVKKRPVDAPKKRTTTRKGEFGDPFTE